MARPVIALLTDFGTSDHYAAVMKGVILGICPEATLVDVTHDIPAHDVLAGALELAAVYHYFPRGTIFLAVVDPGVGSSRRAIAAEAGEYGLVGPDNGLLAPILDPSQPVRLVELSDGVDSEGDVSPTFEGRDRFAPAAGRLAAGVPLTDLGRALDAYVPLAVPRPVVDAHGIVGVVLRVDHFGNLISNIERATFEQAGLIPEAAVQVEVGGRYLAGLVRTYSEARSGHLCALFSSTGTLEIAERDGRAARTVGIGRGAVVHVSRLA